jgi:hypothetical protein
MVAGHYNPRYFNNRLFNHELLNPIDRGLGLRSSWLKCLGLRSPGLKLGVENSGVVMPFNPTNFPRNPKLFKLPPLVFFFYVAA